jgi:hypothetical protein
MEMETGPFAHYFVIVEQIFDEAEQELVAT